METGEIKFCQNKFFFFFLKVFTVDLSFLFIYLFGSLEQDNFCFCFCNTHLNHKRLKCTTTLFSKLDSKYSVLISPWSPNMRQDNNIAISLANNIQNIQYAHCLTCPQFFLKISVLKLF